MSQQVTVASLTAIAIILAALLDFGLMLLLRLWLRRKYAKHSPEAGIPGALASQVRVFGVYSPILTWLKRMRTPKQAASNPSAAAKNEPAPDDPPREGLKSLLQSAWIEWLVITIAVVLFCWGILDLKSETRLTGNEAEVFQMLDQALVNSLKYEHKFPLWNPYIQTGLPYVADPMLHVYNPLVTLPVLLLGEHAGFKLGLFLSFWIAALGMWRLGKTLGMGSVPRVWMALMYTFAGQPVGRFFQGQYLFVFGFAWIPWIISSLFLVVERRRRSDIALAAIFLGLLFFSGNAYYPFYMLITAGIFGLVMLLRIRRRVPFVTVEPKKGMVYLAVALLALGVIAIQLLPLTEFWPRLSKDTSVQGSHTLLQIFLDYTSKDSSRADAYNDLPAREEFYAYIGLTPFLALGLLPVAFLKRDRRALLFFLLVLIFAVGWISMEHLPWKDLFEHLKLFVQFRHLLRILLFGSFALIVLAAYGLDTLWGFFQSSLAQDTLPDNSLLSSTSKSRSYLAYGGLILLGAFMLMGVADVFNTNQQYIYTTPIYQPAYTVMNWVRAHDLSDYYVRHNPNNAWQDAVISANLRYIDVWYHFADIRDTGSATNQRPMQAEPLYVTQSLAEPPPSGPGEDSGATLIATVEDYNIYQLPNSLPMAFTVQDAELQKGNQAGPLQRQDVNPLVPAFSGPNRLEVIAEGGEGQTLVVLITNYPGWQVKVDGRPQRLLNISGYMGVKVTPGPHRYEFTYRPYPFYIGLLISLLATGVALYLLVSDLRSSHQVARSAALRPIRPVLEGLRAFRQRMVNWYGGLRPAVARVIYREGVLQPLHPLDWPENTSLRVTVETADTGPKASLRRWVWTSGELVNSVTRVVPLETALFAVAMVLYLSTRLIGLADWPIYFFTDEAVQTVMAEDFLHNGLRNYENELLPTYFSKDPTYNLSSTSVYLQVIPYILFGKSVFVTRAVSVLMTTVGAFLFGLILRDIFKIRYWWCSVLLLSIAPAWFLHSRTAFEMGEMITFYIGFLYFYLLYRYRNPRYLYPSLVCGALAFYTYSPAQFIIVLNGLLLLLSDLRYHWQNRRTGLKGLLLLVVLVLPFVRFYIAHPDLPMKHLTTRAPMWMQAVPLSEKLGHYFSEYLYGFNPLYWFIPNQHDLERHLMKGYGHLLLATLPFLIIGLVLAITKLRSSAHRTALISLIASPSGSALVAIGITRILIFVIPATLLTALGLNQAMEWLERLVRYAGGTWQRWKTGAMRPAAEQSLPGSQPRTSYRLLSLGLAAILGFTNLYMLRDALVNGPLWYQDYTLGGMQYGAQQLFAGVMDYVKEHPGVNLIVSPSWTNGADAVAEFFLPKDAPVRLGSIEGYLYQHLPLDENTIFVMIPDEMEKTINSGKFQDIRIDKTIPYPNGKPGFYFVHLHYVDNIDEILEKEAEARRVLQEDWLTIDGQSVYVRYSMLDMGGINNVFDGDPNSLARTLEANPFVIELTFPEPRAISGLTAIIGSADLQITAKLYSSSGDPLGTFETYYAGSVAAPKATLDFGQTLLAQTIRLEFLEPASSEPAHIHIWEIGLK